MIQCILQKSQMVNNITLGLKRKPYFVTLFILLQLLYFKLEYSVNCNLLKYIPAKFSGCFQIKLMVAGRVGYDEVNFSLLLIINLISFIIYFRQVSDLLFIFYNLIFHLLHENFIPSRIFRSLLANLLKKKPQD